MCILYLLVCISTFYAIFSKAFLISEILHLLAKKIDNEYVAEFEKVYVMICTSFKTADLTRYAHLHGKCKKYIKKHKSIKFEFK
jgi:hypothetical protein